MRCAFPSSKAMQTSSIAPCPNCSSFQISARNPDVSAIKSSISSNSPAFKSNAAAMGKLVAELKERMAAAALGGDERSRKRHSERGKLLPRDRVERLIDPGSPFLDLSPLAPL